MMIILQQRSPMLCCDIIKLISYMVADGTYTELCKTKKILDYLDIVDADMFERKLSNIIKYMD